ncbi:hypothetical protein D1007_57625 [Hordeum vulgare]|nr:hypothetical protein D1007_57625 [Hordeum vulgare]
MEPVYEAYMDLSSKYHAKIKRQLQLVTLDRSMASSCMVNEKLQSVRESATKTILQVAKVVLGFSSYVDGKLMARSSGFLIDWDERSKAGTVLTSARIICSKHSALSQWSGTDEYAPNAEIVAHLLDEDDATVPALLLHYDKHINIALIKVEIDLCAKIPSFSGDVIYGQEIFVLGRDERLNLTIHRGRVQFMGPNKFQRHHYLFSGCVIKQPSIGGPVIDLNGQVWGMANFPGTAFIPSSIILKCLDMWKKFQCIPRLHIGMKLSPIKFLDPIHLERIFRRCNVDSGLIVHEVSHGSVAGELGVRPGDIIYSVKGEHIATTIELENLLMRMCENHLDKGGAIGSCMDIPLQQLPVAAAETSSQTAVTAQHQHTAISAANAAEQHHSSYLPELAAAKHQQFLLSAPQLTAASTSSSRTHLASFLQQQQQQQPQNSRSSSPVKPSSTSRSVQTNSKQQLQLNNTSSSPLLLPQHLSLRSKQHLRQPLSLRHQQQPRRALRRARLQPPAATGILQSRCHAHVRQQPAISLQAASTCTPAGPLQRAFTAVACPLPVSDPSVTGI